MPNLFDAYSKLSDDDIRSQVALMETITMSNMTKLTGQKAHKGIVKTINSVSSLFRNKNVFEEPELKEIPQLIEERISMLKYFDRGMLEIKLREELRKRVKSQGDSSDEMLSICVIDTAANHFDIAKGLTPADKIEYLFFKYGERVTEKIREHWKKSSLDEQKDITKTIDEKMGQLTPEQKRHMMEALHVEDLTGETIQKLLMKTGGVSLLMGAATSFGSYMAITTIIHAIFTTALGITLPFAVYTSATTLFSFLTGPVGWLLFAGVGYWQFSRGTGKVNGEILAQSIFLARSIYGKSFVPPDEQMPSWVNPSDQTAIARANELEELYRQAVKQKENADAQIKKVEIALKNAETEILSAKMELENEQRQKEIALQNLQASKDMQEEQSCELIKAQEKLDRAIKEMDAMQFESREERKKAEDVIQGLNRQILGIKRDSDNLSKDIATLEATIKRKDIFVEKQKKEIERLKLDKLGLTERLKESEAQRDEVDRRTEPEINESRERLKAKWKKAFPDTDSRICVYRDEFVHRMFMASSDLRIAAEKIMQELYNSKNPRYISESRGRMWNMKDAYHARLGKKYTGHRLHYLVKNGNIELIFTSIMHHDEQDELFSWKR